MATKRKESSTVTHFDIMKWAYCLEQSNLTSSGASLRKEHMNWEPKHESLMIAFNNAHRAPITDESAMRQWTEELMEQFRFSFPGEDWGCKSTSPGSTQSFDVAARRASGKIWGYDLAKNGGRHDAELITNPGEFDISNQAFITVEAVNHLGNVVVDPPDPGTPNPPSTPPVNLSLLERELTTIRNVTISLQQTVSAQNDLIASLIVVVQQTQPVDNNLLLEIKLLLENQARILVAESTALREQVKGGIKIKLG